VEQINLIDPVCTLKHVPAADNHELGSGKAVVPVDLRKSGRQKFPDLGKILMSSSMMMHNSQLF
jgi:beta-glucosidase-like glycosyl hydrolase